MPRPPPNHHRSLTKMSNMGNTKETRGNTLTQYTEAPYTATLKSSGDFDSAWLVVRGENEVEIQSRLSAITTNGLAAVLAQADQAFKGSFQVGSHLGGTPVDPPQNAAPAQAQQSHSAPAPQAPPADQNPWGVSAPAQTQQPTQDNPWGQPQQQQPQAASTFEAQPPMVLGMPARKVSKVSAKTGKPWTAWADPRPKSATEHIQERTDDPAHPGLAAGTHTFWQFVRD